MVSVPPPVREKTTERAEPFSAEAVMTPVACVASAEVAPPATPVPSASVGEVGAAVSMVSV